MSERFEIQLSHACNNRCVFCVSGQMTELHRIRKTHFSDIERELSEARRRGAREVTLLGGEPTIQSVFFPALEHAVRLGFEEIVIFTNGARLDRRDFIERVIALRNDFVWRISIQGWDEATHDATTKKPGAFAKIVAGLETLGALGQHVTANMCIVEQNYRSLALLPEFVKRHGIRQVHLDLVRPRDSGERTEDYLDSIMPDYAALAGVLGPMYQRMRELNSKLDLTVGNLPFCLLPEWAHRMHHGGSKTLTVSAENRGELSEPWDKYEDKKSDKLKLESCKQCVFDRHCDGFFDLYARRRGTDVFRPISVQDLLRRDPEQRTFAYQVEPALAALGATPLPGWTLREPDPSTREGWVRLTFAHDAGGFARIVLLPASASGGGDGEHEAFVLRLEAARGLEAGTAPELCARVFALLASALPGSVLVSPTPERISRRRAVLGEDSALLPSVQRLVQRLLDGAPFGAWRVLDASASADATAARVELMGPGGDSATLRLAARERKTSVSWEFHGRGELSSRRRVAQTVNDLLRRPAR